MKFDQAGRRILATDQEFGSLFLIDLAEGSPTPVLLAENLGPVFDLDVSENGTSVLTLDTSGRRVLQLECPQGSDSCSAPELFAAIPEFEQPVAVTRATDGTVWVGDLAAQSIFAFDPDGQVVAVLDSMSGFRE